MTGTMSLHCHCDENQNRISDNWSGVKQDFFWLIWQQVSAILKGLPWSLTDNGLKYPSVQWGLHNLNQMKKGNFFKIQKEVGNPLPQDGPAQYYRDFSP